MKFLVLCAVAHPTPPTVCSALRSCQGRAVPLARRPTFATAWPPASHAVVLFPSQVLGRSVLSLLRVWRVDTCGTLCLLLAAVGGGWVEALVGRLPRTDGAFCVAGWWQLGCIVTDKLLIVRGGPEGGLQSSGRRGSHSEVGKREGTLWVEAQVALRGDALQSEVSGLAQHGLSPPYQEKNTG